MIHLPDTPGGNAIVDGVRPSERRGDGECDESCNVVECNFDGDDCFADFGECYRRADGSDYRGAVSETWGGISCQLWSHQFPHTHTKTHINFPDAGLGGHNRCRNPDADRAPWCYTVDADTEWDYCNVSAPSTGLCNRTAPAVHPPNVTEISLGVMVRSDAREHEHKFFHAVVPASVYYLKVVVVPVSAALELIRSDVGPSCWKPR